MDIIEYNTQRMISIPLSTKLLQSNIVTIAGDIDEDTVNEYQQQLLYLKDKLSPGDIITLWINSNGGSVYDGLGLFDLIQNIKESGIIVQTVNAGKACSMASLLLMGGTPGYRKSLINSSVLIHEISSGSYGKLPNLEVDFKECRRLQDIINHIISTYASEELIKECYNKDLWLSSAQALQYNIIDKLI